MGLKADTTTGHLLYTAAGHLSWRCNASVNCPCPDRGNVYNVQITINSCSYPGYRACDDCVSISQDVVWQADYYSSLECEWDWHVSDPVESDPLIPGVTWIRTHFIKLRFTDASDGVNARVIVSVAYFTTIAYTYPGGWYQNAFDCLAYANGGVSDCASPIMSFNWTNANVNADVAITLL